MIHPAHFVAIFGGGVAGSEAAYQLSRQGIYSVLFEQNPLPYGKIEEGLPKWHIKLRNKEERKIDEKLSQPGVFYVPNVRLDEHFKIEDIIDWGFSAVLLAIGAWRDRALPIPGIEQYLGKGFYYQNRFVSWFNHKHEPGYEGTSCEICDNAIVIGGGLASLDVVKILMLETTRQALGQRGHEVDLFTLEHLGIPRVLKDRGLTLQEIGVKGCTLYYRRRIQDMPLAPMPSHIPPEKRQKIYEVRRRILKNFQQKYLFQVRECHVPVSKIVEGDRLGGLVFEKTVVQKDGSIAKMGEQIRMKAPLVISSIGSIPEPVHGTPMAGDLLPVQDRDTGRIEGYHNVFALGNAVTGRGNIKESQTHGRRVSQKLMDHFLTWEAEKYQELIRQNKSESIEQLNKIAGDLESRKPLPVAKIESIMGKIRDWQKKVGYEGDYHTWISRHLPPRLEDLLRTADVTPD